MSHPVFWQNALANFLGSLLAATVLWFVITKWYELPKSKRENRELLAVSYGLFKRELDAAVSYCAGLKGAGPDQVSVSLPITQAWETLHSTEAFKYISPVISEKLVKCYSMIFRLKQ
jgi:hypothetical protein